jgi:AraC family transcriptional regulator
MSNFSFPDQQSQFENIASSEALAWSGIYAERTRTTPGFNRSPVDQHTIAVHLSEAVPILHRRGQQERIHTFQAGDVLITPVGEPIEYAHPATVDGLYIYLEPQRVEALAQALDARRQAVHLQDALGVPDPVIARIGADLLREIETPDFASRLYVDTLTTQLGLHLLRRYAKMTPLPTSASNRQRLQKAIDYIHAHLSEDLSLAQIAASEYLSPFHFSRVFKDSYGVSPHQYVIQQRVAKARELLTQPNMTVTQVAHEVGFASHAHLIRHYKRITGSTPRQSARMDTQTRNIVKGA